MIVHPPAEGEAKQDGTRASPRLTYENGPFRKLGLRNVERAAAASFRVSYFERNRWRYATGRAGLRQPHAVLSG